MKNFDRDDKLQFISINEGTIKLEDLMGKILFRFRGDDNHVPNIEHQPDEIGGFENKSYL